MLLPYGMAFLALVIYVIGWPTLTFLTPRIVAYSHHSLDLDGVADLFAQHVAGDQVEFEDQKGGSIEDGQYGIDLEGLYWPLDMKQPE